MKLSVQILLLLLSTAAFGQENATLTNGALSANFGPGGSLQAPGGDHFLKLLVDGEYKPLLFDGSLMIAGINDTGDLEFHDLRGGSATPGIIGNTDQVNTYWRVTAEEIEAHQADYADNGIIDNPIASIFAWPGRGNPNFEEYNGFSIDPSTLNIASYWDLQFNAIYEPERGDYPILNLRGCLDQPFTVTEMIFFPLMSTPAGATTPSIQIYLTAFRVGCEEQENPISNSIFLHYKIIKSTQNGNSSPLTDVHLGFYADGDIGCPFNDYMGTFPDRSATYFYNATADDDCTIPPLSIGQNPPALAVDIFRIGINDTGIDNSVNSVLPIFNAGFGNFPPATTDYNTPLEAYNYLRGNWRDGSPLLNEGIGYNTSGAPANIAFNGDPTTGEGWSEVSANNPGGDRRAIIASERFSLFPGSVNELIVGFTYSDDPNTSNIEKINGLRDNIDIVQGLFDGCFTVDASTSKFLGCSPLVTHLEGPTAMNSLLRVYPNPASNLLQIEIGSVNDGLLQVYKSNGQLILEKEIGNGDHELYIADWPKGIYLLQWKNSNGLVAKKLVVQ